MVAAETSEKKARATGARDIIEGSILRIWSRERREEREMERANERKEKEGEAV